jgi:hypothetical protein
MGLLGWSYGKVWKNAVLRGGPWSSQYVMISALSIYLVMQTGEAVIFRTIMLSLPCWLSWKWALKQPQRATRRPILFPRRVQKRALHVAPGFSSALNTEPLRGTPHA